jgi:hypothetical protein
MYWYAWIRSSHVKWHTEHLWLLRFMNGRAPTMVYHSVKLYFCHLMKVVHPHMQPSTAGYFLDGTFPPFRPGLPMQGSHTFHPKNSTLFQDCFLGWSQSMWLDKTAAPRYNRPESTFCLLQKYANAIEKILTSLYWSKTTNIYSNNIFQDFFRTFSSKYRNSRLFPGLEKTYYWFSRLLFSRLVGILPISLCFKIQSIPWCIPEFTKNNMTYSVFSKVLSIFKEYFSQSFPLS